MERERIVPINSLPEPERSQAWEHFWDDLIRLHETALELHQQEKDLRPPWSA